MNASVTTPVHAPAGSWTRSNIRVVRDYPHARTKVWRALTEPALMSLWGMRPEGFAPVQGTHFKLHGQRNPMWRGYIDAEVIEVNAPSLIGYRWVDNDGAPATLVRNTLEETGTGTRLTVEHTGFVGVGGFLFSKLIMGPGLRRTFNTLLPVALADVQDDGTLRSGSNLRPLF